MHWVILSTLANASHELRTPLTVERTLLQVALDDPDKTLAAWRLTAEELLSYSDEQTRLIEALLTLASSENGTNGHSSFDLADVVTAALAKIHPEADRMGIRIVDETLSAPLQGDPLLIERLVANLLNNSVRHNIDGGRIEVTTAVADDRSVLTISNTGSAIPASEVDRLFQPFQRLDPRRAHHKDGHGLGLSIVWAIGSAHRATISAYPRPNGGLTVSIAFPQTTNAHDVLEAQAVDAEA